MIRHAVRNHKRGGLILGGLGSVALLALACSTPVPTSSDETTDATGDLDAGAIVATQDVPGLSEAGEGYFLVRKVGDQVEYVGPVSEEMEFKPDGSGEGSYRYYVRGTETASTYEKVRPFGSAEAEFKAQAEGSGEASQGTVTIRTDDSEAPPPLYVVDGVIISDPNFMDRLDKLDIQRVEVIKGAAAKEQYGERAANGVVLIFTKG